MNISFFRNTNLALLIFSLTSLLIASATSTINSQNINSKLYNTNNSYIFIQGKSKYNLDIAYRRLFNRAFYINGGIGIKDVSITNNITKLAYGLFIGGKHKNGIEYSIESDIQINNSKVKKGLILNIKYNDLISIECGNNNLRSPNGIFGGFRINTDVIIRHLGNISNFIELGFIIIYKKGAGVSITADINIGKKTKGNKGIVEGYNRVDSILKSKINREINIKQTEQEDKEEQEELQTLNTTEEARLELIKTLLNSRIKKLIELGEYLIKESSEKAEDEIEKTKQEINKYLIQEEEKILQERSRSIFLCKSIENGKINLNQIIATVNKAVKEREKVKARIDQLLVTLRGIKEEYELVKKIEELITVNEIEMKVKSEIETAKEDYLASLIIESFLKKRELVFKFFQKEMEQEASKAEELAEVLLSANNALLGVLEIFKIDSIRWNLSSLEILFSTIIEEIEKTKKISEQQSFLEVSLKRGLHDTNVIIDRVNAKKYQIRDSEEFKNLELERQKSYKEALLDIDEEFKALKEAKDRILQGLRKFYIIV